MPAYVVGEHSSSMLLTNAVVGEDPSVHVSSTVMRTVDDLPSDSHCSAASTTFVNGKRAK